MRIVSLLPSATEICFALGAGDDVVGVTFECDYPPEARTRQIVSTTALPEGLTPGEIDVFVRERVAAGEDLYHLDAGALRDLAPDVVITQDLCKVCAIDADDVTEALNYLGCRAEVVTTDPHNLAEVLTSIETIAKAIDRDPAPLLDDLRRRLRRLAAGESGEGGESTEAERRVDEPASAASLSGGRADEPARGPSHSGERIDEPGTGAIRPGIGTRQPGNGTAHPASGTDQPGSSAGRAGTAGSAGLAESAGSAGSCVGRPGGGVDGGRVGPRVGLLEWTEPAYAPGHWLPEMVGLAGGVNVLGTAGQRSTPIGWQDVAAARPEVIVCAPCGYDVEGAERLTKDLLSAGHLPDGVAVWAVDANGYFARPGPRLVDGIELLATLLTDGTADPALARRLR